MKTVTITQARHLLGLSQQELSEITGISRQTIIHWESGESCQAYKMVPYVNKLTELARQSKVLAEDEEIAKPEIRMFRQGVKDFEGNDAT